MIYSPENCEYDQEIPQLQTADKPIAPWATQQSRDTKKTH